jgi:hypothetical protein
VAVKATTQVDSGFREKKAGSANLIECAGRSELRSPSLSADLSSADLNSADLNSADLNEDKSLQIGMELRFSWRSGEMIYIGTGRTKDLSETAVCFEIDQDVADTSNVEVRIPWPSRLQSICPLELVLRGPLVRKSAKVAVLQVQGYEFETRGEHSFNQFSSCGVTCNVAA